MKALAIPLAAGLLLAACNRETDEGRIEAMVSNTLAAEGNVQQIDLTRGADNNYNGTAAVRRPDGQAIRFNCSARRNEAQTQWEIRCGQVIDETLLAELESSMRRSLEQQSLTVSEIDLTRQDDDRVTGFAQVSDPATGETARLVCTGGRQDGGRILARCDVPGAPAPSVQPPAAGPAPAE